MHPLPSGRAASWLSRCPARFLLTGLAAASWLLFASAQTPPVTPAADPIEGTWTGTVTAPQGTVAEIGFAFFRSKKGPLIFKLYFPSMFTYGVPTGVPVEADGHGNYAIVDAFDTYLHLDGDRITGTFALGKLPLVLKRGGHFSPAPPAPDYPTAPAPLWTHPLGEGTWAPPVVDGGMIYVGTRDGKFHAVRTADGSEAWTWSGQNRIDGRAITTADSIYFVDGKADLVALNRTGGTLRWRYPLHDEQFAGKPAPDNPTFNRRTASPLILADTVYCGSSDGGLYALNAATGAKLWRHDARAPVFSGIALHGADTLMFGTMDGSVVLLDRRTRQETLRVKTGGGVVTTPLVVGDKLIVGSRDYLLYGFNLADGSLAWRFSYWFSWVESTPVLCDGLIYVGASDYRRVTVLDPATGRAIWGTDVRGADWGSPLVTANTVFIGTIAQNIPGTVIQHTGGIMALDRATGDVKWQYRSPPPGENSFGGYAGSLALAGDKLIAIGFDGMLTAFPVE